MKPDISEGRVEHETRQPHTHGRGGVVLLISFVIIMVAFLGGCDMFSTREPDEPTGEQSGSEIATSPDEALQRLADAVALRDPDLYMTVIDSAFSYSADASAYPDNPAFFDNWGYDKEDQFARRLLNQDLLPPAALAALTFTEVTAVRSGDSADYRESYRLDLEMNREDLPHLYEGLANLKIIRSGDGGWRIRSWGDEASGDEASMSLLRAAL